MIRTRVVEIDTSGTNAANNGTIGVQNGQYAGAYYQFSDPNETGDILIKCMGQTLLSKSGAANTDGVQDVAPSSRHVVAKEIIVSGSNFASGGPGDKLAVTLFLDV